MKLAAPGTAKPLSVRRLGKHYATADGRLTEALLPVDLDISSGEFLVLIGPSGCGKSTLLNILAGLTAPSAGEARVGDALVQGPDIDRGMVFQDYALFPWLDVIGNVEFGLERKGVPRRERRQVAKRYLEMVGLADFANKRPRELSGGMKQRVAIARTFATEPSIIFMDEPFGALDALTRRHLQHQLLHIWQEHRKTVVFVTHSVVEAIYLADRIVVMTARPGRIKTIVSVALPHPRDPTSEEFRSIERRIYDDLDEELTKSFNMEGRGSDDSSALPS
jgi:ABC-type nitrate/sulfonate/bicarbonate transport system ATPase subunit